jgi:hypothetical protein
MQTITAREISDSLFGAWRLAHLDPRGMQYFDTSINGFWRSFWAAAVMVPPYALIVILRLMERQATSSSLRIALIEIIAYVIGWTAFPLAAWYLLSALGKQDRYLGYIVAYNWANVLQICVYLPVTALDASGGLPDQIMVVLAMAATAAVIFYQYYIARTALEVDMPIAAGLVFMDLMLGILLHGVVATMEMR